MTSRGLLMASQTFFWNKCDHQSINVLYVLLFIILNYNVQDIISKIMYTRKELNCQNLHGTQVYILYNNNFCKYFRDKKTRFFFLLNITCIYTNAAYIVCMYLCVYVCVYVAIKVKIHYLMNWLSSLHFG